MRKLAFCLLAAIAITSGCISTSISKETAVRGCTMLCESVKEKQNISAGPCLSEDVLSKEGETWVCDVAHSPRQDIDNKPQNQCPAYIEGRANHFVEVDTNCKLIRAV